MTDSRIHEITRYYNDQYKQKMGVAYKWSGGKEQKLMKTCIRYFENQFAEQAIDRLRECIDFYLSYEDDFLKETAYDMSHLLTQPNKWLKFLNDDKVGQAQRKAQEAKLKKRDEQIAKLKKPQIDDTKDMSDFDLAVMISKDPVMFMKGFRITHSILKRINPKEYDRVRKTILELLGKEQATKLWKNAPEQIFSDIS